MKKHLRWFDRHFLFILSSLLIVFIPLYPKLPLFDILPGYIVRVRIEDFLILFASIIWVIQLIRKKATWHRNMTKLIAIYLVIGLLSTISAVYLTKTVPNELLHIGKTLLHYFRRIEYFMLFFITYSAIKTQLHAKISIFLLIPISLAISIYGYGQKYLYWPVYSTMNREFSKGMRLYLTEHARVPSTFAGHYDAAAYIVIVISIMLAFVWFSKKRTLRFWSLISFAALYWLLILTASRTSFIAYLGAISVLGLIAWIIKSAKFAIPRYLVTAVLSIFIMVSFGDLSDRFAQIGVIRDLKVKYEQTLDQFKREPPENAMSIEEAQRLAEIEKVTDPTDQRPVPNRPLPGDVYEDIPDKAEIIDKDGNASQVDVERTFSDNAYKYGLSAAIRLDTLWPQALAGLRANPLLGAGYATLTKPAVGVFTEAESTDNDYLRTLGETGILGFLSFFAIIGYAAYASIQSLKTIKVPVYRAYLVGYATAVAGLLVNAIYIDVFVASKVAQSFWAFTAIALILPTLDKKSAKSKA